MTASAKPRRIDVPAYGSRFEGIVDLEEIRKNHRPFIKEKGHREWDGNATAAGAMLQFWREPIYAGFPITPSTKWLEMITAEIANGTFMIEKDGKRFSLKTAKLLEAEHAVADYLVGAAAACRDLIFSTATSSVGLDHMTETVRSLGASGLGNVVIVNVYRCTANFPICIEGDPSDTLAQRDSGFIQVSCRGGQQIYDTMIQSPVLGMHPEILTPTMPGYYGMKDSHKTSRVEVSSDDEVNAFHDKLIQPCPYPSLINGDTSMGNIVTSEFFTAFKFAQKERFQKVFDWLPKVGAEFKKQFGRTGVEFFETFGFEDNPNIAVVAMGPDAGTLQDMLPRIRRTMGAKVGLIVARLLTPFPSKQMAEVLKNVDAVGVVNNAHHFGRGHLTLDVADALNQIGQYKPIESFFTGLGGGNVSVETWESIVTTTIEAGKKGKQSRPYHLIHEGREFAGTTL